MRTEKKLAAGILAICKNTGRILLGRRSADDASFPGYWAIFGGTFEDRDGSPKQTAKREFKEETKYSGSYEISKSPIDTRSDNMITYYTYIGLFDHEFAPDINGADEFSQEHADYGWFELDHMPDNLIGGLRETLSQYHDKIENVVDQAKKDKLRNIVRDVIKRVKK